MLKYFEKKAITRYIKNVVESFPKEEEVHFIQVGYRIDQVGLLCVYLDTNDGAGPDGSWTLELDKDDGFLSLPTFEIFKDYDTQAEKKGELIKEVILSLRDQGIFKKLNLAEGCDIGIEEFDGGWGWPEYEKRKTENLA